jgi:replication factor A2
VEVKQWIDGDTNQDNMDVDSKAQLTEDGYCRVWGRLKAFNNKRHVGAHVIRPITDYNEINYHLLEATAVHLFFTRGPPGDQAQGQKGAGTNGMNGGQQEYSAGGGLLPSLSPIARRVFTALKEAKSNEGLHCQMLASNLGMSVNDVYKGAEELLGNGVIFTTVDDNTWAVLDM